jgi:hypothetical protein
MNTAIPVIPAVTVTAQNALIISAVQKNGFRMLNDHRKGTTSLLAGVSILTDNGRQTVVAMFDSTTTPYYTMNEVILDESGELHLTRNAVSTMFACTTDPVADIANWYASFDWELIGNKPCLHPGFLTNLVTPALSV